METSKETRETKFINSKYLSKTSNPTFNDFASRLSDDIAIHSTSFESPNAYKLMSTWITYYNTAVHLYRTPQTPVQKHLKQTSITFKTIYIKTNLLIQSKESLIASSIEKSAAFINHAGNLLQQTLDLDANQETSINASTSTTIVTEPVEEGSSSSPSEPVEEGVSSPTAEDKDPDQENNAVADSVSNENIHNDQVSSKLIISLDAYTKTKKFLPVSYQPSRKSRHLESLLEEACLIVNNNKPSSNDINFIKLALSNSINLLGHTFRQKYAAVLPGSFLDTVHSTCATRRCHFVSAVPSITTNIDSIFKAIKQFQFDASADRLTHWIDSQKATEKDKHSYNYQVLKVLEKCIDNFTTLNKRRISETTYCSLVRSLLETILMGSSIDVIDGESVPESTKRMAILNQCDAGQFGRRADLLIYESYQSVDIEYAVVEFKKHSVSDNMQEYQQVKNIRINATTLNDYISLTKDPTRGCVYMDWSGPTGYMVELFKFQDIYVAHHISPLHLPLSLIELGEFESDLKLLYKWRDFLIESSQMAKVGLVQSKRKYDTLSISSPTTPSISPNRSPPLLPVGVYFSPSKSKKAKTP